MRIKSHNRAGEIVKYADNLDCIIKNIEFGNNELKLYYEYKYRKVKLIK